MNQDELKAAVGQYAADYIAPLLDEKAIVGVGTGSTANCFIEALGAIRHKFDGAVASSAASQKLLEASGIRVYELNDVNELCVYVDGADEINGRLEMIKGGGGALTREKIVASVAASFVCIVDESKIVDQLGAYPLPVEVIPMARSSVAREIVKLGGQPVYREGFITDNGNQILDIHRFNLSDPREMESRLNQITGLVTNGLFALRPANTVLVGTARGVVERSAESP